MKYLAHKNGEREQTVKEHLTGTVQLAGTFAAKFGKEDWGYCSGMLHDIGKYSVEFQKKIQEECNIQVDHSTAGARVCREKGGLYPNLEYCIAGHHAGLPDYGSVQDQASEPTLCGRRKKKIKDYHAYQNEIEIPPLTSLPFDPMKTKNPHFAMSVFIRMLYSCLVDADFLDTERFMQEGKAERDSGETIEILLEKLEDYISSWLQNTELDTINGRRTEILKACLESGRRERGLFRLTVPTGGGKTVASLAFALRHAVEHHMDRVIYVIPYTSIIEQNAQVFRDILGEQNILENHCNVEYESEEELRSYQLAAENWDKPVVVTTNVQFFESLFGNKSSKCRKLHNIANSVIIFDEAQMLPNDYLKPCIAMIEELLKNYRSSIVLCTATQPALQDLFQNEWQAAELCPRMEEQFTFFKRTVFQNIGTIEQEELIEKLGGEHQALCIVNTKKRAQALYEQLQGEGVYHLSTSMYPKHRKSVLEIIRKRLHEKKKCIVISTSLVEAGVDLDFQSVYRQLSGVDSIIQAAGRCNRHGNRRAEESKVSIFQFQEKEYTPGQRQQMDVTRGLLVDEKELSDLGTIDEYFKRLYRFRGDSLDKKNIMGEFQNRGYNFAKVGKEFRLIEESTKTIFVGREEEAKKLIEKLRQEGFTKNGMRKAGQYCINVYGQDFDKLYGAGMVREVSENLQDFYELVNENQYTEELGLKLDLEYGIGCFM